jgi:hypothetical protein
MVAQVALRGWAVGAVVEGLGQCISSKEEHSNDAGIAPASPVGGAQGGCGRQAGSVTGEMAE